MSAELIRELVRTHDTWQSCDCLITKRCSLCDQIIAYSNAITLAKATLKNFWNIPKGPAQTKKHCCRNKIASRKQKCF